MKKIYLAALTLAMTACVSNDDLNPVDNYGYIDVNVSNDPVMVTRAEGEPTWIITATKDGNTYEGINNGENKVPAGTYKIYAQSHSTMEYANKLDDWGVPYYSGESNEILINAGESATASVYCGKAKNSKITGSFNLINKFTDCKLILDPDDRALQISKADNDNSITTNKSAFFSPGNVNYSFTYKYNDETKGITGNINCIAGNEHYINISSNKNGTINVVISYDTEFGNGDDITLNFDAATGEQLTNQ